MRVTFYYPCKYEYTHARIHGPMGLTYIAAHLGRELGISDIQIEVDIDRVIASRPDIVGISAYTETYPQALTGAGRIRAELAVPVVLGGPHVSAVPQYFPGDPFDVGVVGEGEHSMVELVRSYQQGEWGAATFARIPGLVYRPPGSDSPALTPAAAVPSDLDTLCYPRRELMQTYWPPLQGFHQWEQAIYTSRGCPFRCSFCVHSVIDAMPRYHSPERVVAELESIVRFFPRQKTVSIHDDIFVVSKKRLRQLVDLIKEAGIHRKLAFVAMIKPSTFDAEVCQMLKEMNMAMIAFGFESGSPVVLKYLKGRGARLKQNQEAVALCERYNIRICGYFILGSPMETTADLARTYWFMRRNIPAIATAGVFHLTPYPGTRYWHDYQARSPVAAEAIDWNWFDYRQLEDPERFFINEHYTPALLATAFEKFYQAGSRLLICQAPEESRIQKYKAGLYETLRRELSPAARVLEVATAFDSFYESHRWDYPGLEHRRPHEAQAPCPQDIEAVFLNHCLEQQREPLAWLKAALASIPAGARVFLSFYHGAFHGVLTALLQDKDPNVFDSLGFFALQRLLSREQVSGWLAQCGWQVLATDAIRQTPGPVFTRLAPLLPVQAGKVDWDIYAYLLTLGKF